MNQHEPADQRQLTQSASVGWRDWLSVEGVVAGMPGRWIPARRRQSPARPMERSHPRGIDSYNYTSASRINFSPAQ